MDFHIGLVKALAKLLDSEFKIFNFKIGLDPLIGLIPWVGDAISFILSLYIVWIGYQLKLPKNIISQMFANVIVDFLLGTVPIIGDISDFFYRANKKNLDLLLKHTNPSVIDGKVI